MNVLIIEDQPSIANILKMFLEPLARTVTIAHTMQEALAAITPESDISIITLDLGLPDSGIRESIKKIKEIRRVSPNALVVVVTGNDLPGLEKEVMEGGADAFVLKQGQSFTPQGFIEVLRGLVSKYMEKPQDYRRSVDALACVASKIKQIHECHENTTPDSTAAAS